MRNISSCHGDIDEASDKCPIKRQIRNVITLIVVIYDMELKRGGDSLGMQDERAHVCTFVPFLEV